MPIQSPITAISGNYSDIAVNYHEKAFIYLIGIFYPSGEAISPHRLRRSPFAVVHYSFMGHFLAAAAILTRE
jgi:hypothetical protein